MGAELAAWMLGQVDEVGSPRGLLVLSVLALHADEAGELIMTWRELCERTKISRSQLGRELAALEERGLVKRSSWKWGQAKGATRYALRIPEGARVCVRSHSPNGRLPGGDSVGAEPVEEMASGVHLRIQDPLSGDGLRAMLVFAQEHGWDEVSDMLGEALEVTVDTRLGWLMRRRVGVDPEHARADLLSRMWEVLRTKTDSIIEAKKNPWGLLVQIVAKSVAREDCRDVPEVLVGEGVVDGVEDGGGLDHERGVGRVVSTDLFESWGGAHQKFLHVLVSAGIEQGLAFNATRRMLQIAAGVGASLRITRARSDVDLLAMGLSEKAIGAWMGLLVGTRRGGDASSLLWHLDGGGEITEEFRVRVERLVGLV